jgi:glycerophosphoryl diester phosphodiesterase
MSETIQIVQQALKDARVAARPVVLFLIGWSLVYGIVLSPLSGWLMVQFISRSGHLAVSNYDIAAFLFTPSGIAWVVFGGALNLAFVYAQQAGLFLIASQVELEKVPGLTGLLWQNFKRIPDLARLGLWQLLGFLLLFLPFGAALALIAASLLGAHDINFYLATSPPEWMWTVRLTGLVLGGYALAAAVLFVRWILAVPLVILSGEKPWACLRQSWQKTRGKFLPVARPFIFWWAGWPVVAIAVGAAFTIVAQALLDWAGSNPIRTVPLLVCLEAVAIMGGLVAAFLGGTIHQFLLARLYWHLHPQAVRAVESAPAAPVAPVRHKLALAIILCGALIASAFGTWQYIGKFSKEILVEITAHRGSSRRAPENTLSALRQAIIEHADYAEIDVQTTKDGHVVLLHDGDLMRVAKDPRKLASLTLAELRQLDIGSWFAPAFKDERIATLEEAIDLARGRIKLNIELKYNRPDPELGGRVVQIIRNKNFTADCVITSLEANELFKLKHGAPELPTGMIVTAAIGDAVSLPVDFFSVDAVQVSHDAISLAHRRGMAVHVWTVNDEASALQMIEMGADNLITDEPALLLKLRKQLRELNRVELIALTLRTRFNL